MHETLSFLKILRCLYDKHPNGCLCLEYRNICKHYPHYPFCQFNIEERIEEPEETCKKRIDDIHSDLCFVLTGRVLEAIGEFLCDSDEETFYGSLAYYSHDGLLLFCAIDFIDDVMPPEVAVDNIGCIPLSASFQIVGSCTKS